MAANTQPIFTLTPRISWGSALTAANTNMDGTGTVTGVFTAGANGSFLKAVQFRPLGTNVSTVARVFINNGSTNTVAANNAIVGEVTIPASTASNTTQQPDFIVPLNFALPATYVVNVTIGTAVAAGIMASVVGGDY